jgi:hypothetical protein
VLGHAAAMQLAIVRDPRLLPGHLAPLSMLSASQRLLDDVFRVWFPMLQMVLIVVVTGVSVRALVRSRARALSGAPAGPTEPAR